MLVTDATWAEFHPVKRALVRPYDAWRCVGWTDEVLNFVVVTRHKHPETDALPDGFLVGGTEALLEVAAQREPGSYSVYVLDHSNAASASLRPVTAIWRERDAGGPVFWYETGAGERRPCSRINMPGQDLPDLVEELVIQAAPASSARSR